MRTVTYEQVKTLAAELAGRADDTLGSGLKLSVSEAAMLRAFFAGELPDLWNREAWPELCDHLAEITLDANRCFAKSQAHTNPLALLVTGAGYAPLNGTYPGSGQLFESAGGFSIRYNEATGIWTLSGSDVDYCTLSAATPVGDWTGNGNAVDPAPSSAYATTSQEIGELLALIQGGDPRLTTQVTVLKPERWVEIGDRINVVGSDATVWADWQTLCPDLLDTDTVGADINDYPLPARFKLALAARGAALLLADEDPARAGVLRGLAEADLLKQASRLKRPWWRNS